MKRILFVDDEKNVLQGLRRMLHSLRKDWDMDFAESGEAALLLFEENDYDVIVTDMKMPGMDGAELLARVLEKHPKVARIILSGHAERSSAVRAAGIAHQFLAKPCDAEELKRTVARTCALRERLSNRELLEKITGMGQLPSLPEIFEKVRDEMEHEDASIGKVGDIVSVDIGMSAKILQLVNSAFFGLRREIESVTEATNLLGMDVIRDLVLSSSVFEVLKVDESPISMESLWRHGIAAGCVARGIARELELDKATASESAQAAMLLEAGRIAMATRLSDDYREVVAALQDEDGLCIVDAERQVFGCAHPEIGGYLLGLWGLSDAVVEAITFHHDPESANETEPGPVAIAFAADLLVSAYECGEDEHTAVERLAAVGLQGQSEALWRVTVATMGNEEMAA